MKKILSIFLVLAMLFAMTACKKKEEEKTNNKEVLLLGGTAAIGALTAVYYNAFLGRVDREPLEEGYIEEEMENLQEEQEEESAEEEDFVTESVNENDNVMNILVVCDDDQGDTQRDVAEIILLITVNKEKKSYTITSFMLETYVQIPSYGEDKLNKAYGYGGMETLTATLLENFGVEVDRAIQIHSKDIPIMVAVLGSVEVTLTAEEAAYLNDLGNWDTDGTAQWDLKEGTNSLTETQLCAYMRIREVGNGSFGQTNRQRIATAAVIEKMFSLEDSARRQAIGVMRGYMETDLSYDEHIALFSAVPESAAAQQIPAEGAFTPAYFADKDMSVLIPDLDKNREILENIMAE